MVASFRGGERTWYVRAWAPEGETLGEGRYEIEAPTDLAGAHVDVITYGLPVPSGTPSPACSGLVGSFDVVELDESDDGTVEHFALDIDVRCNTGERIQQVEVRFDANDAPPDEEPVPGPVDELLELLRLAGEDRVATAIDASQDSYPTDGSAGAVVLSRADGFADALAGTPLAAAEEAPILLTPTAALDPRTLAEIERILPSGGRVHLLGGTGAIGPAVAAALTERGYVVTRHAGADRYTTAVAVAEALGSPEEILLVTGRDFPDGLAAGAAAAS